MIRRNGLLTLALTLAVAMVPAAPALAKDGDRLPDKWEKRHNLNLKRDDSRRDLDKDGLSNYGEYRAHTSPRKRDSDRDGRRDSREDFDRDRLRNAVEIKMGYDPGDADSDDDGVKDGKEHAGQITQLDDSSITITLAAGGGSITALLSDELQVKCKSFEDKPHPEEHGDEDDLQDDGDAVGSDHDEADEEHAEDEHGEEDGDGPQAEMATNDEDEHASEEASDDYCAKHLKVGAIVHKAKIELTGDGAVLVAIKLVAKNQ